MKNKMTSVFSQLAMFILMAMLSGSAACYSPCGFFSGGRDANGQCISSPIRCLSCSGVDTEFTGRDLLSEIASDDEARIDAAGARYAQRFALSDEQGVQLARTIRDYSILRNRSEQDLADIAQRLYGVNPSEIVSAVAAAQLGERDRLNALVEEAALHFGTTPQNMKVIVRDLHGPALLEAGVDF